MSYLNDPRVLFAAERTMLAWTRSSLGLIAFGFLVERSGLIFHVLAPAEAASINTTLMLGIGLAFMLLGVAVSLYATWQFDRFTRILSPAEIPPGYNVRWSQLVNLIVALMGVALALLLFADRL